MQRYNENEGFQKQGGKNMQSTATYFFLLEYCVAI